jgi:prepilin signal peptidase PulO-like enzyme (type II secretory pathway)
MKTFYGTSGTSNATPTRSIPGRRPAWLAALSLPAIFASLGPSTIPFVYPLWPVTLAGLILMCLLLTASWTDATCGKVFNWATYPSLAWALGINLAGFGLDATGHVASFPTFAGRSLPIGDIGLSQCLLGAFVGFAVMLFLYRLSGGGAGDVKLATAIGALVGFRGMVEALMFTYVAAGLFVVARGFWVDGPVAVIGGLLRWSGSAVSPGLVAPPGEAQQRWLRSKVRLAPFFAIGTLASLMGGGMPW